MSVNHFPYLPILTNSENSIYPDGDPDRHQNVGIITSLLAYCQPTLKPHYNNSTALFPEPPGWASARRELLDFMVQGKINIGRHTDHAAGRHSIRTNQCPPPPSPIYFTSRMPFLPPNLQRQSTIGP